MLWVLVALPVAFEEPTALDRAVAEVRAAALAPNRSADGRPLPLFASWNVGGPKGDGWSPTWQWEMLQAGHRLLPWLPLENPSAELSAANAAALAEFAKRGLPVAFVSTQWEHLLTSDKKLFVLPAEENPNVVKADGSIDRRISPFGSEAPWREVGARWGQSAALRTAAEIYPNPPRVWFLSNNEHRKLVWKNVEDDRRYIEKYGAGRDDDFKRQAVGDGWIARYRALQAGFREALPNPAWSQAARFAGYNAFGQETMGRWPNWPSYSLHRKDRISPWPLAWDGGAPSFYTNNWEMATDYTVFSPQVQCMNWVFMLEEAHRLAPEFWFEMSLWDGHTPKKPNDKYRYYADRQQKYSPERYAGMAQFGMWLLRPRVVREFRGYLETRAELEPLTQAVMKAIDDVHRIPALAEFWRQGTLVPNPAREHPWNIGIPPEYAKCDRWFLLDAAENPTGKWKLQTELKVFALALVQGEKPHRRWLVYAHAPLGDRLATKVTIPDFGEVEIDATVGGAFTTVDEAAGKTKRVK